MKKRFTSEYLDQLFQKGMIRGYNLIPEKKIERKILARKKPKAWYWIAWNLDHFAKENKVEIIPEYRFAEKRKYRFDFAFPTLKIAVEYEGIFQSAKSRHTTKGGFLEDTNKYNLAAASGWIVIRLTGNNYKTLTDHLRSIMNQKNQSNGNK